MIVRDKYKVYDVSDALSSGAVEYLGSKRKGWLTLSLQGKNSRVLFKQGRPGTGENWAEKVTSELAALLDFPCAIYDLAYLAEGDYCVISPNFLETGEELRLGNELIEGFDKEQKFKNTKHTLGEIFTAFQKNNVQLSWKAPEKNTVIASAFDLFIGYLCFDAWVGNTDRHAENWGVITKVNQDKVLAPTFDHASSLGRNELDTKRKKRLQTSDTGFNVLAYAKGAVTPIFDDNGCALNTISLIKSCNKYAPEATRYWMQKIENLMNDNQLIWAILNRIPDEFISEPAKEFAMALLIENVKLLRELEYD